MKVLIVDPGGRGHALAWKIAQSPLLTKLFIAPGSTGTGCIAENVGIEITDIEGLLKFAIKEKIDLTIVGSEESLEQGIVDIFQKEGLKIFGPTKEAAKIEWSKSFAKRMMFAKSIITPGYLAFNDYGKALEHMNGLVDSFVIKANGLAKGKGVHICKTKKEGKEALYDIMINKIHGCAGDRVVIEDYIEGEELSIHLLHDIEGTSILFPSSKDYKNFKDENTGGMGGYAPAHPTSRNFLNEVYISAVRPALEYLSINRQTPFSGCLYPGIILTPRGLRVLEYNVRFGDPEALLYMTLLKSDVLELLLACVEGRLSEVKIEWHDGYAVCVVLASDGYPGKYEIGFPITGIDKASLVPGVTVFHAGTKHKGDHIVTDGGRVLNIVAYDNTLENARKNVYEAVKRIRFKGMCFKDDIGLVSTYQEV
ncbi:MAG: phosphoribosylamine--glycine ligase [Candidatus Paceibacteria bacterium]